MDVADSSAMLADEVVWIMEERRVRRPPDSRARHQR